MGKVAMNAQVDFSDVQGLVRFGYKRMTKAHYDLLQVKDAGAAREWLRQAPVTPAETRDPPPKTALQVAFTVEGIRALGTDESIIEGFSHEFRSGMAASFKARQLGDTGKNAPENWEWGGPGKEPHLLVMLFGEPDVFEDFLSAQTGGLYQQAFELQACLDTADLDGVEPFGFADGISQPKIDWEQKKKSREIVYTYENLSALGEFLLGYPNEYGNLTRRPLVDDNALSSSLDPAPEDPRKRDLGRNGTYLVLRQLDQDVRKFWDFIRKQTGSEDPDADGLAAAMVGRHRDGSPLVKPSGQGDDDNNFNFDADPEGHQCPFGAHVRRANPRNADYPERPRNIFRKLLVTLGFGTPGFRDDVMSSVRFHRILRRGREYGSELKPEDAKGPPPADEPPRGLHFICLNANICRQFEFIQNAWLNSTKFAAMTGERDPLVGNHEPPAGCPVANHFNRPGKDGLRQRVTGLETFVTVRGGAYFFLPGLRALRYLAGP